jgi:hypothetical protein
MGEFIGEKSIKFKNQITNVQIRINKVQINLFIFTNNSTLYKFKREAHKALLPLNFVFFLGGMPLVPSPCVI